MTATLAPSTQRNNVAEETKTKLVQDARALLQACGVDRGANWLSRTVRDYLAAPIGGLPFGLYLAARVELSAQQRRALAERDDLRCLLSYADPTGESAVRNVMRDAPRLIRVDLASLDALGQPLQYTDSRSRTFGGDQGDDRN